jgi:hypothetical protein
LAEKLLIFLFRNFIREIDIFLFDDLILKTFDLGAQSVDGNSEIILFVNKEFLLLERLIANRICGKAIRISTIVRRYGCADTADFDPGAAGFRWSFRIRNRPEPHET